MSFLLLALSIATTVAPPATAGRQQPPEKAAVSGVVLDAGTDMPLKKARLTLSPAEGREQGLGALTDAAGKFSIRDIPPGRYRLFVERNGYVRQEFGQRTPGRRGSILTLGPGQNLRDLIFRLIRSGVVSGRVVDEDGEPVPHAVVLLHRQSYEDGRRRLEQMQGAQTNDLGEYRLFDLVPGRYYVSAAMPPDRWAARYQPGRAENREPPPAETGYVPTFYPGTTNPARASPVEVAGGQEVARVDFVLSPTRAVRVRGRVINMVSGQEGRVSVALAPRGEAGSLGFVSYGEWSMVDSEGHFELHSVTPGDYWLVANLFHESRRLMGSRALEVGVNDVENADVVIAPGVDLDGRVGIEGQMEQPLSGLRVTLLPRGDLPTFFANQAGVKDDGTFRFENVGDGIYDISIGGLPAGAYLKSAHAGTKDVLENGLEVSGGAPRLEIDVSNAGAVVEGLVLNGDKLPVAGATVVLVPDPSRRPRRRLYKTATTDQFGRFTLQGIAPGKYKLFAWEEVERGAWFDPEFLRPVEPRGLAIEVDKSEHRTVELEPIPAGGQTK